MWSGSLRVKRIVQETPEVRTLRLVSPVGARLPFDYLAGQYLILSLLIAGRKVTRTYTIASSPARPTYCALTIKREEQGLASRHLHDNVREGDLLNVSAPAGRFTFDETRAKRVVLIAGGVGITPLMAILRYLTDRNWKGDIHFLYCAKSPRDIIFRQELEDLQRRFPNLHLVVTLTRAQGIEWAGRKGRITGELLAQTIPNLAAQPVFICGSASMMEPTIQLLREQGVPGEQIRSEAFLAAPLRHPERLFHQCPGQGNLSEAPALSLGALWLQPEPAGRAVPHSVGTAMPWFWENIHSENDYPVFAALGSILNRTGWGRGASTNILPGQTAALSYGTTRVARPGIQATSLFYSPPKGVGQESPIC